MARKVRHIVVSALTICVVIIGLWGGIVEWQNSKHYIGTTEVPLNIALSLQNIPYVNGDGIVKIIDTSCPSGNVAIRYDFYSVNSYSYLTVINERENGQLGLMIEFMFIFSALGSVVTCMIVDGLFSLYGLWRKGKKGF
jgi:hypothetical protein